MHLNEQVSVVSNATQTSALRARIIVNDSQPSGVPAVSTSPTLTIPSTRGYLLFALPLEEDEGGDDIIAQEGDNPGTIRTKNPKSVWTTIYWKRYFRPMLSKAHYKAFVHVALLDSIFACLAWSFLFMCITVRSFEFICVSNDSDYRAISLPPYHLGQAYRCSSCCLYSLLAVLLPFWVHEYSPELS